MNGARDFKIGEIVINTHKGDEFFNHYCMVTEVHSNFLTVKHSHAGYGTIRNLIPSHGEVEKVVA